jgi:hypothetical protein
LLNSYVALAVTPATPAGEPEPAKLVRHNFTVEVRLDIAGRDIVSSKIVHVQTGDEAAWAGWEPDRVVAFIEDRAGTRSAEPTIEPVPETGLALHTFAMVSASGAAFTAAGPIAAILSFDARTLGLPADQPVRAKVDIYARRPPPGKSLLAGSTVADISPAGLVQIQVPSHLPGTQTMADVFAAVQLLAAVPAGRRPTGNLPDARLTLTASSASGGREMSQGDASM